MIVAAQHSLAPALGRAASGHLAVRPNPMFQLKNQLVGISMAFLCLGPLVSASQGQEGGPGSSTSLAADAGEMQVVRIDVDEAQLDTLASRFEVVALDRVTRTRSVVRLAVTRLQFQELQGSGFEIEVDEDASRVYAETRGRRAAAAVESSERVARGADPCVPVGITSHSCYRTLEETYAALSNESACGLASTHPHLATWLDMGDSLVSGHDIGVLKITDGNYPGPKAPFVIIAATHSREYVTAETATRFAEHLVQNFGVDPDVTAFLRHVEVWIMPVHNPDGREVAEVAATNMKRKNLRDVGCSGISQGVDLNRNSEQYFRYDCMAAGECTTGLGYSTTTCDPLYSGPNWPNGSGSAEPETLAVNDLMALAFTDQRGTGPTDAAPDTAEGLFVSIHSHGRYVLLPWEARWIDPPNFEALRTLGRRFGDRLPNYVVCQDCFGTASGTNVDEAYGRYGVASYTFELGTAFHQNCTGSGTTFEDDIWPQAREALMLGLKSARQPYLEPGGPEIHSLFFPTQTFLPGQPLLIEGAADDTRVDWVDQPDSSASDTAVQPEHDITGVFYSIGLPPWDPSAVLVPLAASDGTYDSPVETFTGNIVTTGLSGGTHIVWLVAEDNQPGGQMGVASAVLIEADFLFADGFEGGDTTAWSP